VEAFLLVAQIVALLCVSALCIYSIVVLMRVREIFTNVGKDLRDISTRVVPVLENLEFISGRVRTISENIDDQVTMVRDSVGLIKEMADNVVALERKVQQRIEGPVLDSVAFLAAIFKGVRTFMERVRA
jgi:uncharacterized protein YoxC